MFFKGLIASLLMLLTAPLLANLGQDNEGFGLGLDTSLVQRYQNQYHFFGAGGLTHALSPYMEYKSQRDIYTFYMLFADTNYFSQLYHSYDLNQNSSDEANKFQVQFTLQYAYLNFIDYNTAMQYAAYFSYRWRTAGQQNTEESRAWGTSVGVKVGYSYFFKKHLNMTLWFTPVSYHIDKYPQNSMGRSTRFNEMRYGSDLSLAFSYVF